MGRRKTWPTAVILDTQSVKNAAMATGATVAFDAGKPVKGRKRLVLPDTLGHVLASRVLTADAADGPTAIAFWDAVAATHVLIPSSYEKPDWSGGRYRLLIFLYVASSSPRSPHTCTRYRPLGSAAVLHVAAGASAARPKPATVAPRLLSTRTA